MVAPVEYWKINFAQKAASAQLQLSNDSKYMIVAKEKE